MTLRLKSFMKELGFKASGDMIFGIYEGYLVSVTDQDGSASLFFDITLGEAADIEREKIREVIEESAQQYSILRAEVKNTGIFVVFDSSSSSFNKLKEFFYYLIQQLSLLKIPGASVCTNCGEAISSINIVCINGRLHTCDKECATKLVETAREKLPRKKEKLHFLSGMLGALLGALLGVLPFTVISRINIFALWTGLIIGLFSKGGYELFGGKNCVGKSIVLPLFSLISSAISVFLSYCYSLFSIWDSQGIVISFQEIALKIFGTLQSSPEMQRAFLTDTAITFAFAVLGLLLFVRFKKPAKTERVYILS